METRAMKKIVFLTGTRAEFGKMKPLIQAVRDSGLFDVRLFVTGMHMSTKYGRTVEEIIKLDFPNIYQYDNQAEHGTMDSILANTIGGFSTYIKDDRPDLIVVHGDRVEALAGAIVGVLNNILVSHIEGGELSGTVDEIIRHAVSKLVHLHFTANDESKLRLIQMGESERNIFILGSPDLDIMSSPHLPSLEDTKSRYEIPFDRYAVLIYHPITTELPHLAAQTYMLVDTLLETDIPYIVIYPNNDHGSDIILEIYQKKLYEHPRFKIFPSLLFEHFLTLLKHALFIIGNSSAGVREAPFYGVPTINVGTRQHNRINPRFNESIFHVFYETDALKELITRFAKEPVRFIPNLYFGDGKSTERFLHTLSNERIWETKIQKQFLDTFTRFDDVY
ncbi:MAG: UDP-N-acetylglucosamine 2-epimerase [Patescibacteria group bacterium]